MRTPEEQGVPRRRSTAWLEWSTTWLVRLSPFLVAAVVVGGVVARFVADSPLWLDEALSVNIAAEPFGSIPDRLRHDGHPPLYYWLLHLWMEVFGEGDTAVRALSGVCAVAVLPVAWALGRRFRGDAGATSVLVTLAASPFLIRYGSEARQYALVSLLALVGWLVLVRAREEPTVRRLVPVALVSAALLSTHYWAAFLLGAVGVLLLASARWGREAAARRTDLRLAAALALGGVLFAPWLPTMLYQLENTGTPWAKADRPTAAAAAAVSTLGSGAPEGFLLVVLLGAFVALGLLGVRRGADIVLAGARTPATAQAVGVVVIGVVVAGVVSFLAGSAFQARYFAVYTPLVLVVAGLGIALLAPVGRVVVLGVVAVLAAMAFVDDVTRDRTQAAVIAAAVTADAGPDDVLVVCPDQLGPAHQRVLGGGGVPVLPYPDLDMDARFVDWVDYLDRFDAVTPDEVAAELVAARPPGSHVWLAWESHYRVVGDECSEFADALGRLTASGEVLINSDPGEYFEFAALHRYRVPG